MTLETIVSHFMVHGTDGTRTVFEVTYAIFPHREGVLSYVKVPYSEHPCLCPERDAHERRCLAVPS